MDLLPPDAGALQRIISRPAAFAGLRFEAAPSGETLDARILADAAKHPDALPLLQYLLRELFESRQSDGQLTLAEYAKLGRCGRRPGPPGEDGLRAADAVRQASLPKLLNALVTITNDDKGVPLRRRARLDELPEGPCRDLATVLVNERLLVSDRGDQRGPRGFVAVLGASGGVDRGEPRGTADSGSRRSGGRPLASGRAGRRLPASARQAAGRGRGALDHSAADAGGGGEEYVRRSQDRQRRTERRTRRRLQITAAVFAALSLLAAGAAVFSTVQWRVAKANAKRGRQRRRRREKGRCGSAGGEAGRVQRRDGPHAGAALAENHQLRDFRHSARGCDVPGTLEIRRNLLKMAIDGLNEVARFSQAGRSIATWPPP